MFKKQSVIKIQCSDGPSFILPSFLASSMNFILTGMQGISLIYSQRTAILLINIVYNIYNL